MSVATELCSRADSPSPHQEGQLLIPDSPKTRRGSHHGQSFPRISSENLPIGSSNDNSNESSLSLGDVRIGKAPSLNVRALTRNMDQEQFNAFQQLIAQQGTQRRRLVTAGSYLKEIRTDLHNIRVHMEGLGGRLERVLDDTVSAILDGDERLTNLSAALGVTLEEEQTTPNDPVAITMEGTINPFDRELPS